MANKNIGVTRTGPRLLARDRTPYAATRLKLTDHEFARGPLKSFDGSAERGGGGHQPTFYFPSSFCPYPTNPLLGLFGTSKRRNFMPTIRENLHVSPKLLNRCSESYCYCYISGDVTKYVFYFYCGTFKYTFTVTVCLFVKLDMLRKTTI